jgi:hypothetical protein
MNKLKFPWVAISRSLLGVGLGLLAGLRLSAQSLLSVDAGTTINGFQDSFSGSTLGANWVVPCVPGLGCGTNETHLLQTETN